MSPLHVMGEWLRQRLLEVPLGAARALFLLVPIALLIWVLTLPRAEVARVGTAPKPGENLRLWAALALLIQIAIYALL